MSVPLRDLDARVTTIDYGDGVVVDALLFDCPACRTHSQAMPFSDAPFHEIPYPVTEANRAGVGRTIKLWQRVSGSTIEDITLAPSFLVPSCNGLHGFVRAGRWE